MKRPGVTIQYVRDLFFKKTGSLSSTLARGTGSTLIVSVSFSCANFALSLLLAREMGAAGYGAYSYAIAWTTLMGVVAKLGFQQVITRDTSAYVQLQDSGRLLGLMRFSFKWILAASLLSIVAAMVPALFKFWSSQSRELQILVPAFILVPLNALLVWASALQQGHSKVGRAQIPSMVVFPLLFIATVLTFIVWSNRKLDAVSVIYMQIVATLAVLGYALVTLRDTLRPEIASASPVYSVRHGNVACGR
jgi:O-antigen/teichoic acid export membrane protein